VAAASIEGRSPRFGTPEKKDRVLKGRDGGRDGSEKIKQLHEREKKGKGEAPCDRPGSSK